MRLFGDGGRLGVREKRGVSFAQPLDRFPSEGTGNSSDDTPAASASPARARPSETATKSWHCSLLPTRLVRFPPVPSLSARALIAAGRTNARARRRLCRSHK